MESIEYGHNHVESLGDFYSIYVDLLNRTSKGSIDKDNLSNGEIKMISNLLEKNRVYKWGLDEFWNKLRYMHRTCFDGYEWYLSLVFEGNIVLNIGGENEYPDTFVNLAEDIKEFTNKDVLKLKTINDIDIYKKYAKEHLND